MLECFVHSKRITLFSASLHFPLHYPKQTVNEHSSSKSSFTACDNANNPALPTLQTCWILPKAPGKMCRALNSLLL